jgi:hypothetical protein
MKSIKNNNYLVIADNEVIEELKQNYNSKINWYNFKEGDTFYNNNGEPYRIEEIKHNNDKTGTVILLKGLKYN